MCVKGPVVVEHAMQQPLDKAEPWLLNTLTLELECQKIYSNLRHQPGGELRTGALNINREAVHPNAKLFLQHWHERQTSLLILARA